MILIHQKAVGYAKKFIMQGTLQDSDKLNVWRANTEKIQKILGWRPKYNLRDGLIKTVEWFRENIYLYEKRG